jgi:hypothetical protein
VWHASARHPQRWLLGTTSVDRPAHSVHQVWSCGARIVGIQGHPAAVEHISAPLLCCYAGIVAERLRNELYIGLCAGQRGRVIHSR